jgi:hypothetical protein
MLLDFKRISALCGGFQWVSMDSGGFRMILWIPVDFG